MATWTDISNAAVAVGGIPSSSTVTALRDNPTALAETASGAPVVFAGWHPYDKVTVGDGKDGLIYDHAINGTVAEIVTPDFVAGYEYRIVAHNLSHDSGSARSLRVQNYRVGSADYSTRYTSTATASNLNPFHLELNCLLPMLLSRVSLFSGFAIISSTTENIIANDDHSSPGDQTQKIKLLFTGGNIDGGKVWMFRRREYASLP